MSESRHPAFSAMMPGAPSELWAIGDPHSAQNCLHTVLPESALPAHFLTGPLILTLSAGATATRAGWVD